MLVQFYHLPELCQSISISEHYAAWKALLQPELWTHRTLGVTLHVRVKLHQILERGPPPPPPSSLPSLIGPLLPHSLIFFTGSVSTNRGLWKMWCGGGRRERS